MNPWMKFYPSDWRADPALRSCSLAARGLWMELLCLMHESEPRGSLLINKNPVTEQQLAMLCGVAKKEIAALMVELETAGVFSRDQGVVYSRRMRRDDEKAARDRANGGKGGNPKLAKGVNPPVIREDKAQILDTRVQKPDKKERAAAPPPAPSPKKSKAPRATVLPEGWQPDESDYAYGGELGMTIQQVDSHAEEMRLWAGANANRPVARKDNWHLAFKSWMRRDRPGFTGAPNGRSQPPRRRHTSSDAFAAAFADAAGKIAGNGEHYGPDPLRHPNGIDLHGRGAGAGDHARDVTGGDVVRRAPGPGNVHEGEIIPPAPTAARIPL